MSSTEQVLDDFIEAWNAGLRPRVREYLSRVPAGAPRDELADRLALWLEAAPAPEHDERTRAAIRAEPVVQRTLAAVGEAAGLWPAVVPRLRARAGLSVRDLAAGVVERFGVPAAGGEDRAVDYLERLERGELEPARVSRRLLEALAARLGVGADLLAGLGAGAGPRAATSGGALYRAPAGPDATLVGDIETLSRAALTPAPPPMDELDRLFLGGPDG
jgi:transcriptional regulator with XRE-family HTH domain